MIQLGDKYKIQNRGSICTTYPLNDFENYDNENRDNEITEGMIIDILPLLDMRTLLIKNDTGSVVVVRYYMKNDNPLSPDFLGEVIVEFAPITERYWSKGDVAAIRNGQIRLGGCWFNFDERYIVKLKN